MLFEGISREFSLINENQYNTISDFWDEFASVYGLENLQGLGYRWTKNSIFYAIGLKHGTIDEHNFCIELPDMNWSTLDGKTVDLKKIYDEIYKAGSLKYEIETFDENGNCQIKYYR